MNIKEIDWVKEFEISNKICRLVLVKLTFCYGSLNLVDEFLEFFCIVEKTVPLGEIYLRLVGVSDRSVLKTRVTILDLATSYSTGTETDDYSSWKCRCFCVANNYNYSPYLYYDSIELRQKLDRANFILFL